MSASCERGSPNETNSEPPLKIKHRWLDVEQTL